MMSWRDFVFGVMIVIIILLSFYVLHYTKTEGYSCISNSAKYFIDGVDKANDGITYCNCFILKNGSSTQFTLDSKGVNTNENIK